MSRDYKFIMHCYQDQYGSDNATANIFVDGTQVATDVEISATSDTSPNKISFDVNGLADPNTDRSVTADIKVVLSNAVYIDASNDRNIYITGLYAIPKQSDGNFKYIPRASYDAGNRDWDSDAVIVTDASIQDDSAIGLLYNNLPTDVQGSQIESDWWANGALAASPQEFYHIPVFGDNANVGTTITLPLI